MYVAKIDLTIGKKKYSAGDKIPNVPERDRIFLVREGYICEEPSAKSGKKSAEKEQG